MAGRLKLGINVFDAALNRLIEQYEQGHRLIVSISSGKDSTVCLEMAILAAQATNRLPVEAVTRDEEILYPGSYEYLERQAERDEVQLTWLVANQPILNAFDRDHPYWWVFDPLLPPEAWVRQPPSWATHIDQLNIEAMITPQRFPPPDGAETRAVVGLRASESRGRLMGVHSSGGYVTGPIKVTKIRNVRPLYDWQDGDIWLAIDKFGWDYNRAYDTMSRLGIPRRKLRISPPMMNPASGELLRKVGAVAFPDWWDRVCRRLPSVRTYAQYGERAVMAQRRYDETWKQCFHRTCIDEAPAWIAERATIARDTMLRMHRRHSTADLPMVEVCYSCQGSLGSWKMLTDCLYNGDPFSVRMTSLPYVEPEFFRPGAGKWNGTPG